MSATPQYPAIPLPPDFCTPGTSTALTGASAVKLTEGGSPAQIIERVAIQALGTTQAGMIRFFLSKDNGTTKNLIAEVPVSQITLTVGAPVWNWPSVTALEGMSLADANCEIWVTTHFADAGFIVTCFKGQF